ncbi:MAG: phenylalanine--tRNA ligase subunit beta [Candidatus Omnitrophica bacterium]|nr:phenylalanine--tRNA ligase subunit beta [Candidatus Omnitrophota bacterium]
MRYSYKILKSYIEGELKIDEIIEYLNILGLNPKIIRREEDNIIFELETPANRPDLLSFIGILKEIMPLGKFLIKNEDKKIVKETIFDIIPVEIENVEDCFYYSCRIIKGINNPLSPENFREIMEDIGFRSSFYVVDISNFVMCEIGQPLHIFDFDKIKGKIIVRRGKKGEKLITIDGKEKDVEDVLIIADEEKPIAIAGIIGGANTEVNYETKNILIESAYFNPVVVRKGSKKLGLSTEASLRFEKGLSISMAKIGMERVSFMIKELCGGEVGKLSFKGKVKEGENNIYLKKENIEKILGIKVEKEFIKKIFEKLDFDIEEKNGGFSLKIPEYRKDIKEEIDLIEEIAKYIKYSEIKEETPFTNIKPSFSSPLYERFKIMKNILVNLGFSEVITLSFISDKIVKRFNLDPIKIENPLSNIFSFLRNSLIFNIMEVIQYNISHQNEEIEIFEFGRIYMKNRKKEYQEKESLLIVSLNSGSYFNFKGKIEKFFEECGLENINYLKEKNIFAMDDTNYGIYHLDEKIGNLFLVSDTLKEFFDIKGEIYTCEILVENFLKYINFEKKFKQLPKFPSSKRDFSFLLPADIDWKEIETKILGLGLPIEKIEVFDMYKGRNLPEDRISVSFSVIFRSSERTLEKEEIEDFSKKIINLVEKEFEGKLRGEHA